MESKQKQVAYTTTNTYETLNTLTQSTKNVWLVFHGIGYLSRYFLKYFNELNSDENYIIAPQAPSKYYLNNSYKHVGASWLTKENTPLEINNVTTYLDAVFGAENIPQNCNFIIFAFSQGVSIATRWLAHKQLKCNQLILYAGGIPNELKPIHFRFLEENKTKIKVIVGNQDEYLNEERIKFEVEKMKNLFNNKAELLTFEGGHEVKKELINNLV
tara:strand:+ start:144554 stop:145198 length:645 start_codon:yes stop_codon:yes gene_type:complete